MILAPAATDSECVARTPTPPAGDTSAFKLREGSSLGRPGSRSIRAASTTTTQAQRPGSGAGPGLACPWHRGPGPGRPPPSTDWQPAGACHGLGGLRVTAPALPGADCRWPRHPDARVSVCAQRTRTRTRTRTRGRGRADARQRIARSHARPRRRLGGPRRRPAPAASGRRPGRPFDWLAAHRIRSTIHRADSLPPSGLTKHLMPTPTLKPSLCGRGCVD